MKTKFRLGISILILGLLFNMFLKSTTGSSGIYKPPSSGPVKVQGRSLLVDFDGDGVYRTYLVKGVDYSPFPIGTFPSEWGICEYCLEEGCLYPDPEHPQISCLGPDSVYDRADVDMDRDFSLLVSMYANTIRTWTGVTQTLLDKAQEYGLKVCAGFWVDYDLDFSIPSVREAIKNEFSDYVSDFKDHPALLIWSIGNEQNLYNGNNIYWYSLVNEMAQTAYQIEGDTYHPVAVVNGDIENINDSGLGTTDGQLDYLDIWGANVYRGYSFGGLFTDFANRSEKPLWISEYGIDAWDTENEVENQQAQAQWVGHLWDEVYANRSISIGATVMEYSDEWWKQDEWTIDVTTQDYEGFPLVGSSPDNFLNEEWWGIMWIDDNGDEPDIMHPRQVYNTLQTKFRRIVRLPVVKE